jgi:hypothetical protein
MFIVTLSEDMRLTALPATEPHTTSFYLLERRTHQHPNPKRDVWLPVSAMPHHVAEHFVRKYFGDIEQEAVTHVREVIKEPALTLSQ